MVAEEAELVDIYVSAHKGPGAYHFAGLSEVRGKFGGKFKGVGLVSNSPSQCRPSRPVLQETTRGKAQSGDRALW